MNIVYSFSDDMAGTDCSNSLHSFSANEGLESEITHGIPSPKFKPWNDGGSNHQLHMG